MLEFREELPPPNPEHQKRQDKKSPSKTKDAYTYAAESSNRVRHTSQTDMVSLSTVKAFPRSLKSGTKPTSSNLSLQMRAGGTSVSFMYCETYIYISSASKPW